VGHTDPERELERFEVYFELETGQELKEEDDIEEIRAKLAEWLDEIDVFGVSREQLASQIMMAMREQRRFSSKAQKDMAEEGAEIVRKLMRRQKWGSRDINVLRMYYSDGLSMGMLSAKLNRSKGAIYHKASRERFKRKKERLLDAT